MLFRSLGVVRQETKKFGETADETLNRQVNDLNRVAEGWRESTQAAAQYSNELRDIELALDNLPEKYAELREQAKEVRQQTAEIFAAVGTSMASVGVVDKTVSDLKGLARQGKITKEQIQELPRLFNEIIIAKKGLVSTNELEEMTGRAIDLGVSYGDLAKFLDLAVEAREAFDASEGDSVDMVSKLTREYGLTMDSARVLMAQAQHFGRETHATLQTMEGLLTANDELIYQLDSTKRAEGLRQLAAVGAGLSQFGVNVNQVSSTLEKLRDATTDPDVASQMAFLGLAPKQIEQMARSGRFAEAFQTINDRVRDIMSHGDVNQQNLMRQLLEGEFRLPPGLADRLHRQYVDFVGLVRGSEDAEEPIGVQDVSASQQFSRLRHLMGAFFTDYGATFQRPYAKVVTMTRDMISKLLDVWQRTPKFVRQVAHWGVTLVIMSKALGKIGAMGGMFSGVIQRASGLLSGLARMSPLAGGAVSKLAGSLGNLGAKAGKLSILSRIFTMGGLRSFFSLTAWRTLGITIMTAIGPGVVSLLTNPWVLGAAAISAAVYGLYKTFKRFAADGGVNDLLVVGEQLGKIAKAFQGGVGSGITTMVGSVTEIASGMDKVLEKLDKAGSWWKWFIFGPVPVMFMKIWHNAIDVGMLQSLQRVEDVLVGMVLSLREKMQPFIDWIQKIGTIISESLKAGFTVVLSFGKKIWSDFLVPMFNWVGNMLAKIPGLKEVGGYMAAGANAAMNQFADVFSGLEKKGREHRMGRPDPVANVQRHAAKTGSGTTLSNAGSNAGSKAKVRVVPATRQADNQASLIEAASKRWGVDPRLIESMIKQESAGRKDAVSNKGAGGLMQLMPDTFKDMGYDPKKRFDPATNIDAGTRYMAQQLERYNGDIVKALAAYNAGPGAVDKYDGVPPFKETQDYVRKIAADYQRRRLDDDRLATNDLPEITIDQTEQIAALKGIAGILTRIEKELTVHPQARRSIHGGIEPTSLTGRIGEVSEFRI